VPATGYTDGYAYSTLRVMRDAGPGGSNVSNDDCKSSRVVVIMLVIHITHGDLCLMVAPTGQLSSLVV